MVFKAASCPRALRRGNKLSLQAQMTGSLGPLVPPRLGLCTPRPILHVTKKQQATPTFLPLVLFAHSQTCCTGQSTGIILRVLQTGTPELWPDVPMATKEWTAEDSNTLLFLERVILHEGACRPWVPSLPPTALDTAHSIRLGRRQARHHRHGLLGTAARAVRPRLLQQRSLKDNPHPRRDSKSH